MIISGEDLRAVYLPPPMLHYFRRKLSDLCEEELLARVEEALKFLTIARFCTSAIPVTKEIDDVWHYWILQTQQYEALCRALPGGEFIHHSSNAYLEYDDPEISANWNVRADVEMLAIYVANFGPLAASRVQYWRLAVFLLEAGLVARRPQPLAFRGRLRPRGRPRPGVGSLGPRSSAITRPDSSEVHGLVDGARRAVAAGLLEAAERRGQATSGRTY